MLEQNELSQIKLQGNCHQEKNLENLWLSHYKLECLHLTYNLPSQRSVLFTAILPPFCAYEIFNLKFQLTLGFFQDNQPI